MQTLNPPRSVVSSTRIATAVLPIVIAAIFSWSWDTAAKLAPELRPRTRETPHFRVHYPVKSGNFVELLAPRLEEAFRFLSRALGWTPDGRIDVVVRVDIDQANGFAEVHPTNRIVIHAVPPAPWGFDSESDDWLRTLVVHELTHLIANDETNGFFRILRPIFGTSIKPNPYQPSWLVEGLAIYEETRFTDGGRGRSAWTDMILRSAANAGLLVSSGHPSAPDSDPFLRIPLDRLNDGVEKWPAGHLPYLAGYLIAEKMADLGGVDAPEKVSESNSRSLPFTIENVARSVVGKGYGEIWDMTVSRMKQVAKVDLDLIRSNGGSTRIQPLTSIGRKTRGPTVMGDFVYFISDSYRRGTEISRLGADGKTESVFRFRPMDEHASTEGVGTRLRAGNGRTLLYSRIEPYREHSLFSDAFVFDLDEEKETRVTFGARAFDPDSSPDFAWNSKEGRIERGAIAYVKQLSDARQAIVLSDGEREEAETPGEPPIVKETILREGRELERLSSVLFGRGDLGDWIFYVSKPVEKGAALEAVHIRTKKRVSLFVSKRVMETMISPGWERDGSLIFSSNEGGIYNLRRIARKELRDVIEFGRSPKIETTTNAETGVFASVEAPSSFGVPASRRIALVYSERGLDLATVEITPRKAPTSVLPLREKFQDRKKESSPVGGEVSTEFSDKAYSVFPALLPHYWAPDIRVVTDGYLFGARTGGRDAWERHEYQLLVHEDTRASFPLWDLFYRFDGLFPTFEISVRQENNYFATDRESNRIRVNEATVFVPAGRNSSFGVGALARTSRLDGEERSTGGFQLSWNFRRMRSNPDSIDRRGESGVEGFIGLTGSFVGEERFSEFRTRFETRIPSLFDRHFFRVNAEYGSSNNDRLSAHYFLGGGEEVISASSSTSYLLRGYTPGSIYGRKILVSNFEYVFPILDLARGLGTLPAFFDSSRLVAFFDTGSAEIVGNRTVDLKRFVSGAGIHLLNDFNFFYRAPVTFAIGFDRGFSADAGAENRFVLGLFSRIP